METDGVALLARWDALLAGLSDRDAGARAAGAGAAGTGAAGTGAAGQALLESWSEPHRRYHDVAHLAAVLEHVDALAAHADDAAAVRLAAWYHDVVYAAAPDDEARSAERATVELGPAGLGLAPDLVAEVARLVRLTASHDPAPGDRNGEALCDADLAILAAPPAAYRAYARAVRAEYAHVPAAAFRAGRADVLRRLLAAPSLFRTPVGRDRWEAPARANLAAELRDLAAP